MIGIMSDSHDNIINIRKAVDIFNQAGCRLVIHAGDVVAPFAARELKNLRCPVKAVFGNCDGEKEGLVQVFQEFGEIKLAPFKFTHENINFLVSHVPVEWGPRSEADVIVFGHTHRSQINRDGDRLLINPGETCGWVKGVATIALLDPVTRVVDVLIL